MDVARLGLEVRSDGVPMATKRLRELEGQSIRNESAFTRLARAAKSALGGIAIGMAATFGGAAVVSTLAGFERSMAAVAAITRATDAELAALRDTAKQLGATTEFTASQAADALKFLGMAGWSASQSMAAIPAVLDLATAAQMDLARAADISSNIMSAFGLAAADASKAADILAAASSRANTDVSQLGDGMKYVGPIASALGISMSDTAAAMGVLSDAGLQGSMAGTGLRQVLAGLANTTPQATKALQALGLDVAKLNPATTSIVDIIGQLKDAGLDAATALTVFGDRGAPAVLALIEGATKLGTLTEELKNVDGEAKRMAETMRDQLQGNINGLMSALEGLIIQMGESGLTAILSGLIQTMTAMARGVTGVMQTFSQFAASIDSVIGVSSTLGGAIQLLIDNMDVLMTAAMVTAAFFAGQFALAIGAKMVTAVASGVASLAMYSVSLGATSAASAAAALSLNALRVAMTVLMGPVGIMVAAVGMLTAAIVLNGRETQRQRIIQQGYADNLAAANAAAKVARERLEDFRKTTGQVSDKVDEAAGKVRSLTAALSDLSASSLFGWLSGLNEQYGLYAQVLADVQREQSKMGMEGVALTQAQQAKARELTNAIIEQQKALQDVARIESEMAALRASSDLTVERGAAKLYEQMAANLTTARATLFQFNDAVKAIDLRPLDAFAGDLWDDQKRAAEQAAEKVQEMITGLKQQLVIDGERNALQKEIVSNLFAAGLAANDNTAGARQIRDLTKELFLLDRQRTQEAKNLDAAKRGAQSIGELEIEIDQLKRLNEALRLGDEAYMSVAAAIAVENTMRQMGIDGLDAEAGRIANLIQLRDELRSRIETVRGGDYGGTGGLSETDRTRRRERFEGLETDLIGGIDNPATRLQEEYNQRLKILQEFHAQTEDEINRHNAAALALDQQYKQAKLELNLASGQQIVGAMAGAFRDMLGEQSAAYKAMFAIQQAFVIASAALSISNAMAQALGDPSKVTLEQKLAAWATIAGASAQIMTAINSVALGFADGGYTGAGGKYDVAGVVHKGEVVWSQQDVARYGGWQNVDAMRRGVMPAANDNGGSGRIELDINVTVDDDGRIAAYVSRGMNEAVNASVRISDQRAKSRTDAMQAQASRPVISARGAA